MLLAHKSYPETVKAEKKPKMVVVKLTDKFDNYRTSHGGQINAGEEMAVPEEEAARLVKTGAAVRRNSDGSYPSSSEKACTRSQIENKMIESAPIVK